eukprot:6078628-Prymnesium_polylepis.1
MPVYFEKINCVKEMMRTIVRNKQVTLLLPDAEVHGEFTQAMIAEIVTDEWTKKWNIDKMVAKWAGEWGVADLKPSTAAEICESLLQQAPLEWSRITPLLPGPHDGAHVPAAAARGEAQQHLPAVTCRAHPASSFPRATSLS